jgi:nucleotide-binding universal stress UspA family protein
MNSLETEGRPVIVVGVDGSAASIEALQWAARTAHTSGAELETVTCWDYPVSYGMSVGFGDWDPAADAQKIADEAIDAAFPERRPDTIRTAIHQGHPAESLIEASRNADMLVVGSRGRGGFVGLLLGSVSAYCAEHAHCPVVVIRPQSKLLV